MKKLILCLLFAAPFSMLSAQEHHEAHIPHFRAAFLVGHTVIPAGNTTERVAIPSYGLDIEYWFSPVFGLGMHNDLEIASFLIERELDEVVERSYPVVLTFDALLKPWKGLVLQFGPGYEFEKNEDFLLFRAGLEYEFELTHHWDLFPAVFYDTRRDAYDTWSVALGVGKRF